MMRLEIKKEKNKYVLQNPPLSAGNHFYIEVEPQSIIRKRTSQKQNKVSAYDKIKLALEKYPENEFLQISLTLTPENYSFGNEFTDEQLLNEALSEKYEL